jgi:hypothetical protein
MIHAIFANLMFMVFLIISAKEKRGASEKLHAGIQKSRREDAPASSPRRRRLGRTPNHRRCHPPPVPEQGPGKKTAPPCEEGDVGTSPASLCLLLPAPLCARGCLVVAAVAGGGRQIRGALAQIRRPRCRICPVRQ